ncbi:Cell surface superoxide dismutase [Cu-Zn] 4 [Lodderomyces elongisporus]|uniref:Cell surface superoxide dismutase [Cu-Zn] 4 n=1 Tax=Lodderomyces elongisporus TaxID=36914 RepID=UPI00291CDC6D|nr:Cell surface superoxide dismutase [Cu-Zn] 4 [Lodderomyces elongisporus]WLF77484.1 Cell surface superoxide dismutase [Cu-Zn] 4 [Lodderomyces elongisporus]
MGLIYASSYYKMLTYRLATGDAPVQTDSSNQESVVATFSPKGTSEISGTIKFSPASNGSVLVSVDVSGLPSSGGPFPYHIHEALVPENGNCTATGGHFNPFNGSASATEPAAKEVGDLAGRHGNITTTSDFKTEYVDNYLSLNPDSEAYFGNLSVVIHSSNNSRLTCANLESEESSGTNGGDGGGASGSNSTTGGGGASGSNSTTGGGGASGSNSTTGSGGASGSSTANSASGLEYGGMVVAAAVALLI